MTPEQRQEEISKAYLQAVAAKCGYAVASWSQDHGGIDATVGAASSVGGGHLTRPKVDIQLKATTQQTLVHDDFVSWTLERAHYDSLRATPTQCPHLLVVLVLPEDVEASVEHTAEQLVLRRCAYWVKMTGMEAVATASRTVRLPKSQVFSPGELLRIMTAISQGTFG